MNRNTVITCQDLSKSYHTVHALSGIAMTIEYGESVAIIGANGAGKTTFFNIMLGCRRTFCVHRSNR